jgi:hypothetical protein
MKPASHRMLTVDERSMPKASYLPRFTRSEDAAQAGVRLEIQLSLRNFDRCHEIIDRFAAGETVQCKPLDTPLIELVELRTCNVLETIGVLTIGQALEVSAETMLDLPNFGVGMLREVQEVGREFARRVKQ